jgi:hypothetical protein
VIVFYDENLGSYFAIEKVKSSPSSDSCSRRNSGAVAVVARAVYPVSSNDGASET